MAIAELISQAVLRDGLNALTLYPCEEGWQASARFNGSEGWRVCVAETAVQAIIDLLSDNAANDNGDVFE